MKTNKEELENRKVEYDEVMNKFNSLLSRCKYGMDELEQINNYVSLNSPIYDIPKEDIEDPEYYLANGLHPLFDGNNILKKCYDEGCYGKRVIFESYGEGTIECISYDYSDYYYKFLPDDNEGSIVYLPLSLRYKDATN